MFDGEAFGQQMVEIVRGYVDAATAPLLERIDALEKRELVLPEKGEPGEPGLPGERGMDGRNGENGKDGRDGIGLADALKDDAGNLVLVLTDGRTKSLGPVDGKDGEPGQNGRDGLGFDDLNVEQIGERTVRFVLRKDAEEAEFDIRIPVPIYRGVFKEADEYETGDLVTWAGSLWHCNEPKALKPGVPESGWQLAAKAGRPGKDAK